MYTRLAALPPWFKRFTKLEYLYIQGKPDFGNDGFRNLEYMPPDTFDDMPALAFIHLAEHADLPALPSFQALSNLRALTLAILRSIRELPGLERLTRLERMVLIRLEQISELPDLSTLRKLRAFHLSDVPLCCNGFITGTCDASDMGCAHSACISDTINNTERTATTRRILQKFSTICPKETRPSASNDGRNSSNRPVDFFSPMSVTVCNAMLYRECSAPGASTEAMCYNALFMPIWCDMGKSPIEARRREIAAGVGAACDPVVEAWLGCQAT